MKEKSCSPPEGVIRTTAVAPPPGRARRSSSPAAQYRLSPVLSRPLLCPHNNKYRRVVSWGAAVYVLYTNITITRFFSYEKNVSCTSRRALLCRFRVYPGNMPRPAMYTNRGNASCYYYFRCWPRVPAAVHFSRSLTLSLHNTCTLVKVGFVVELPLLCAVTRGESRGTAGKNDPGTARERGGRNNNKIVNSFWVV